MPQTPLVQNESDIELLHTASSDAGNDIQKEDNAVEGPLPPRSFHSTIPRVRTRLWSRIGWGVLWLVLVNGALLVLVVIPYDSAVYTRFPSSLDTYCGPSSFTNPFEPDVNFGTLNLNEARIIDLSWNIVVGRGAQGVIGFILYKVFTNTLMRIVESNMVAFDFYHSLVFENGRLSSIIPLAMAVVRLPNFRARFTAGWLLFCTAYLVLLPTMLDAISGYSQPSTAIVKLSDSLLVPVSLLQETFESSSDQDVWQYNGKNYTNQEIKSNLECVPGRSYQWGFSLLLSLVFVILSIVVVIVCYSLWLDADINSEFRRKRVSLGPLRAMNQISEMLTEDLGPNIVMYSDKEITKTVKQRKLRIKYYAANKGDNSGEIGLSSSQHGRFHLDMDRQYSTRMVSRKDL